MEEDQSEIPPEESSATICEKMGHFSRECPEPPKQHNQAALTHRGGTRPKNSKQYSSLKPSYKARVAVLSDEEDPDAFCFCTGPQKGMKAEEWVVDSETTHIVKYIDYSMRS